MLVLATSAFADKFIVPFPCYPKEIQQDFKDRGYKLDLDSNERTQDSWGFLKNEGSQYIIYTYRSVPKNDNALYMLLDIANKTRS